MDRRPRRQSVSRRAVLKTGVAAASGAALLGAGGSLAAQAPAVLSGRNTGRRFRAFVTRPGRAGVVEELTLLPLGPRSVLVRVEASAPCYTMVRGALGLPAMPPSAVGLTAPPPGNAAAPPPAQTPAQVANHTNVGIVEEVGPQVKRVQVGDRVIVGVTSYCGQCYQCLHGDTDYCQFTFGGDVFPPIATAADGMPVAASGGIGGLGELTVTPEEYCCPIFTSVPPAELSLLGDQLASGFAAGICRMPLRPGSNVVVFGAGSVGMGAVQVARVMGAAQVIVVEPIRYRRDMAMTLGATVTLDPNAEGAGLVEKIRDLCKGPTDRRFAGGFSWVPGGFAAAARGADYVINTVGRDNAPSKVEQSPDPTGILPMQQAWEATRMGGHVMNMGIVQGNVTLPGTGVALLGKTVHPGQQGGINMMRDLPRFVKLMERGVLDARTMIQGVYSLDRTREAVDVIADRTAVATVVTVGG